MPPPTEDKALAALRSVQTLSPDDLDHLVSEEIGTPLLGVFSALVRASDEGLSDAEIVRRVHLMVLGFLLRKEVELP